MWGNRLGEKVLRILIAQSRAPLDGAIFDFSEIKNHLTQGFPCPYRRALRKKPMLITGVARVGVGETFKLAMIQSSHRFGLAASSPNLSESSLAGWAPVLGFAALTLGPFGLATQALRAHPPNWIQPNLAPRSETKPVGLIKSFGSPPQTPGRQNVQGS